MASDSEMKICTENLIFMYTRFKYIFLVLAGTLLFLLSVFRNICAVYDRQIVSLSLGVVQGCGFGLIRFRIQLSKNRIISRSKFLKKPKSTDEPDPEPFHVWNDRPVSFVWLILHQGFIMNSKAQFLEKFHSKMTIQL